MSKIGILTFQNTVNYGTVLQCFALYKTIEKLGHTPVVIDYKCPSIELSEGMLFDVRDPKSTLKYLMKARKRLAFKGFKSNITYTPRCDKVTLPNVVSALDMVVVGSDQVWNPLLTNGDLSYFLSFEDEPEKCKTYAVSMGIKHFPSNEPFAQLISHFSSLLVRESSVAKEIERVAPDVSNKVSVVLDPTFLLNRDEWNKQAILPERIKGKEYILLYAVSEFERSAQIAKQLAGQFNCEIVQIRQRRVGKVDGAIGFRNASPEEFLGLFANAKATVVSSFHGLCFSLIFQKEFYCTVSDINSSRLTDLLASLGVKDRVIYNDDLSDHSSLDYVNQIEPKLKSLKSQSIECLNNSIGH